MQIVSEVVGGLLPPSDWLPIVSSHLDLAALVVRAASRIQATATIPDTESSGMEFFLYGHF